MSLDANTAVRELSGFLPALRIGGGIEIPTYFIIISAASCVCLLWLTHRTKVERLNRNTGLDIALVTLVSGFIGARLFHILFEAPSYYAEDPIRVFYIWQGGFVWYGGALAGTAGALAFIKSKRLPFGRWADLSAPIAALGYALGRVACFFTGCCYGDICHIVPGFPFRYPTQAFSVVWETLVIAGLLYIEREKRSGGMRWFVPAGRLFATWLAFHALGRIIMEAFRADDRGPVLFGLSVSTWISFALIGVAIGIGFATEAPKNTSSKERQ